MFLKFLEILIWSIAPLKALLAIIEDVWPEARNMSGPMGLRLLLPLKLYNKVPLRKSAVEEGEITAAICCQIAEVRLPVTICLNPPRVSVYVNCTEPPFIDSW